MGVKHLGWSHTRAYGLLSANGALNIDHFCTCISVIFLIFLIKHFRVTLLSAIRLLLGLGPRFFLLEFPELGLYCHRRPLCLWCIHVYVKFLLNFLLSICQRKQNKISIHFSHRHNHWTAHMEHHVPLSCTNAATMMESILKKNLCDQFWLIQLIKLNPPPKQQQLW